MLYDLYSQGILSFQNLIFSITGAMLIIAAGILLFRLKVVMSLQAFAGSFALLAVILMITPPSWWLKVLLVLLIYFFGSGIFTGILCRNASLTSMSAVFRHSPLLAFVGIDDEIVLHIEHRSGKRKLAGSRITDAYCDLEIDGIDSPHCETLRSIIPLFRDGSRIERTIPVRFILRGHDENSTLYCSVRFRLPYRLLIPWKQRLTLKIPPIPVLSSTFAPLAGKPLNIPREEKLTRHATERISRLRTEAFLHIAPYTPGEPLSQIDFKATLRAGEIVSRKFAHTIEMRGLVALGFGRRAFASREGERLMAELGTALSENTAMDISSDVTIFDTVRISRHRIGHTRENALKLGRDISSLQPSHYEEDEFCITEDLGQSIRDYTHLKIIVAWGGQFDLSRAISAAQLFRRHGALCEIRVIAREVFSVINGQKDSAASRFFLGIMNEYTEKGRTAGISVKWINS